jgi:hypothetical protein
MSTACRRNTEVSSSRVLVTKYIVDVAGSITGVLSIPTGPAIFSESVPTKSAIGTGAAPGVAAA